MNPTISIEIDEGSGFCFGVVNAIQKAEDALKNGEGLYSLGDIVHNNMETKRLEKMGLTTIDRDEFERIENKTILLRAHGEPPSTYEKAKENNTKLIDATCPVVLRLQRNVSQAYQKCRDNNGQVVIYGKIGHAEVNGLVGQTNNKAIVIESLDDMCKVDLTRPVHLFSQTTMMVDKFLEIKKAFEEQIANNEILEVHNSVCHQVSGRIEGLQKFSDRNDVIVFVSGKKSSNGKALFSECLKTNKNSYMVADENEVQLNWFKDAQSIGICGATSTPVWLMKNVAHHIKIILNLDNL